MTARPHLEVGYVSRAHGLAGELAVKTFDPASEVLFDVDRVRLKLRDGSELDLILESVRQAKAELLVELEGVQNRSEAERLRGATVLVFREDLDAPAEGEYFQGDLVGLEAFSEAGELLGAVEEIWATGPVPNLVVRGKGGELLIPFADEFVLTVDLPQRRLTVRPPELLE